MKTCHHCGSTNPDAAKFCLECGNAFAVGIGAEPKSLPSTLPPKTRLPDLIASSATSSVPGTVNASESTPSQADSLDLGEFKALSLYQSVISKQRKADIVFVLDCTHSMQGEIDAVKDAIADFADTIEAEAVRARVGLIEFRDRLIREEHRVITFNGQPFTSDPKLFRQQIAHLRAHGGGDLPESSLDAVMLALQQPFAPEANKVIVLVTDAPPHIPDAETKSIEEVVGKMREVNVDQIYIVMQTQDPRSQVYLKLFEGTRGLAFEIGKGEDFRTRAEHFKRTLMALGKTISSATR